MRGVQYNVSSNVSLPDVMVCVSVMTVSVKPKSVKHFGTKVLIL